MRCVAILLGIVILSAVTAAADTTDVPINRDTVDMGPAKVEGKDTVLFSPGKGDRDSNTVISPANPEEHLYQNPTVALFKSLAVPGLGQLGNHAYFKAALFAGLEGWFISSAVHYGKQASDFRRQYDAATSVSERNALYAGYKNRRDQRNKYTWFAGITAFVSMFDAYVDAHLSGSPSAARNRKVDLSAGPGPGGGTEVKLAFRF